MVRCVLLRFSSLRTLRPRRLCTRLSILAFMLHFVLQSGAMYEKFGEKYAKFRRYVIWLFRLYELNTQIAICEPWEKVFCHVLLSSCMSLLLYASYAYVPGYCLMLVAFLMPAVLSHSNSTNSNMICGEAEHVCSSSSSQSYLT